MLRKASKFFDAALKKEWKEGEKRIVTLPDDNPDSVYAYIQWLYGRKLFVKTTNNQGEPIFEPLATLYVLGEKLLDGDFQDNVLSKLFAPTFAEDSFWPGDKATSIIYRGTPPSSPARRLFVDSWARFGFSRWIERDKDGRWEVHDEFKTDLIEALLKNRSVNEHGAKAFSDLEDGRLCEYHKHGRNEHCTVK